MSHNRHLDYRPDVDGLRAIAVLSVIGFHGFPRVLPGGFVGVDVFFVISGFLISGIIFRALQQGCFSYADFYARRIKRIFPALLTVLTTGLIAGWFVLLPSEYKSLAKHTVAGAGFVSNLLLWSEAGYFDTSAQTKPLLHLWSLGVEEQFYLTWPLIVAVLYKRVRHLPWALGLLLIGSFTASIALTSSNPSAAFYSPLTRFWELLLGATLAYASTFQHRMSLASSLQPGANAATTPAFRMVTEALSWGGLILLGSALSSITQQSSFPGWWALLPTAGAVLLIAARDSWLNRVMLSNRILVFVGMISYPLYLWHWLLLSILRIRLDMDGAEAPRMQRLAAVALSFLLAWLTYVLIEKPIRFGRRNAFQPITLFGLMAAAAALGAAIYLSDGGAFRYPVEIRPLAAYEYDDEERNTASLYRAGQCFLDNKRFSDIAEKCTDKPDGNKPLLVVWGDSHAASLYPGLKAKQYKDGNFRIAQFTSAGCPPMQGVELLTRTNCRLFNDGVLRKIASLKPDIVLMEGDWWFYYIGAGEPKKLDLTDLQRTIGLLKSAGIGRVVVFGNLPVWNIAQPRVLFKEWQKTRTLSRRTTDYLNKDSANVDKMVESAVAQTAAVFISPIQHLCTEEGCLLSARQDSWVPVAWDGAHLSLAGSELLVGSAFPQIFGDCLPGQEATLSEHSGAPDFCNGAGDAP